MFDQNVLNRAIKASGLAIKAGGSAIAKTVNAFRYVLNGSLLSASAGDVALTGISVATGYKLPVAVYINSAGAYSVAAADSAIVRTANFSTKFFSTDVDDKSIVGFILIDNNTGSAFTGGTTALDTGSLTVEYIDVSNTALIGR